MVLPTPVKISGKFITADGEKKSLDVFVSDELLYNVNNEKFNEINLSMIRGFFGGNEPLKRKILAFLNTLMIESNSYNISSCKKLMQYIASEVKQNDIVLTFADSQDRLFRLISKFLTEQVIAMMVRGVYRSKVLPDNSFVKLLETTLYAPSDENIEKIKTELQLLYVDN